MATVRHISESAACPFYVQDAAGCNFCFIKNALTLEQAAALVDDDHFVTQEDWSGDCEGSWDNCNVLPLVYDFDEGDVDPNARDEMEDYSPFDEDEEQGEEAQEAGFERFTPPAVAEASSQRREAEELEQFTGEKPQRKSSAKFGLHRQPDPYKVKCDGMLFPVNNLLEAMDPQLMRYCGAYLDSARMQHREPIQMGHIYPLQPPSGLGVKKFLYRGVVSGVQAVSVVDIESSVRKALYHAEANGVEILAMVPMDYGGFDLESTAQAQLSTIYEFLVSKKTKHLKHIVILIIDDETMEVYEEYQERIFGDL